MNRCYLFIVILLIFIGCSKVDDKGFYLSGKSKDKHKITKTKYDPNGYDINGFDKFGFNREGYNEFGFNSEGFNKEKIHKITKTEFNEEGYDCSGYNKKGYNKVGYDKDGFNEKGYNFSGFDKNGYNIDGFNIYGYDKDGFDKNGYNNKGFNKHSINKITKTRFNQYGYNIHGKKNAFEKKYFVDNFGDPTDQKYILQTISGVFSNSATDNSPAYIELIYSGGNKLRFDMHEYNQGSKAHYSSYERYKIRLKSDSGKTLDDDLSIETSLKGCLMLFNSKAVEMVKKSNNIKVYIYEVDDDYPWQRLDTKYSFTIDCTGFIDGMNYLK